MTMTRIMMMLMILVLGSLLAGCHSADEAYVIAVNQNLEWMVPDYISNLDKRQKDGELTEFDVQSRKESAQELLELSRKHKNGLEN